MQKYTATYTLYLLPAILALFALDIPATYARLPANAFIPATQYPTGPGPTSITAADLNGDGQRDLAVTTSGNNRVALLINRGNGTFPQQLPPALPSGGTLPVFIRAAKLHGQQTSVPDLVSANAGNNRISLLTNTGNGSFQLPSTISTDVRNPASFAVADLDNDGDLDLVVANQDIDENDDSTVSILFNQGDATFQSTSQVSAGRGRCCSIPYSVVATDLNNDGAIDVAVAWIGNHGNGENDTVSILLGNGNGTFQDEIQVDLPVGDDTCDFHFNNPDSDIPFICHFLFMTTAELNGDRFPDLAIVISDWDTSDGSDPALRNANTLYVLLNQGGQGNAWQGFDAPQPYVVPAVGDTAADPFAVVAADLDGDGDVDLVTANRGTNRVTVFHNDGNGIFNAVLVRSFAVGGVGPYAIAAADLDGDCDLDLAVVNRDSSTVAVLLNRFPQSCPSHDFNASRRTDLLWRNASTGQVSLWLLNRFQRLQSGSVGQESDPQWHIVGAGDVDGDGNADIVWWNETTFEVSIWLLDGLTRRGTGSPGASSAVWRIVGVRDVNRDGKADLVWYNTANGRVVIWLLNGFTRIGRGSPGEISNLDWQVVGVDDVDDDGRADVIWRNQSTGKVLIWLLNGTAQKDKGSPGMANTAWQIVGVGDTNGDGRADLVWQHNTSRTVRIWLLNGLTRLSIGSPGTVGNLNWRVRSVGNVDNDGKADLIWRHDTTGQVVIWLLNGTTRRTKGSPGSRSNLDWDLQPQ